MFFMVYLRILGIENTTGGASTRPREWRAPPPHYRARPLSRGPRWPPPLIPAPTHSIFLPKKSPSSSSMILAHFSAIFDLLAQSYIHKTAFGDCCLVCDSSIGPISFCSSALFIPIFCCSGDHGLELSCQIYMVKMCFNA